MLARARVAGRHVRLIWIGCAGVVGGFGIWATHFIGMLAYQTSLPVAFAPTGTFLSMLIAAAMCSLGFWIAVGRLGGVIGGSITGLAIASMHYIGMASVLAPAVQTWEISYIAVSVIIGVILMAAGMWIVVRWNTLKGHVAGTVIFTLAICSMHFTGMTALTLKPDPTIAVPTLIMAPGMLAVCIAAVAFLVIALGLIAVIFDTQQSHVCDLKTAKSQLETLTESLKGALQESLSAQRAKATFFAAMSHELRTPLNAIIGFSELLASQVFEPPSHARNIEYVNDIHDSGLRLLSLINDVLDISCMDAGKLELRKEIFSVDATIIKALRTIEPLAMKAGVRLTEIIPPDLPKLSGDPQRIEQMVLNLLSNAVKFTPENGDVEISLSLHTDALKIIVVDSGIGIAKEDIPKVFERFIQVDGRLARKYEGAGLGLPICKHLVELHGGTLTIDSILNAGTTATVTLPIPQVAKASMIHAA
jgi:signal transduction histidine kinase